MNNILKVNTKYIIPVILILAIIILCGILFFLEIRMWDRVIIPFLVTCFIATGIYYVLNKSFKDKFVSKIFLISILLHLAFILFWQILKYYGLGFHMPTDNVFECFKVDGDGGLYHRLGVDVNQHIGLAILLYKKLTGGWFPKIIGIIYHFTGNNNPFLVCCFNSLCAGLIAPIIYYIGKVTLKDVPLAKLYSLFFIITFAHLMNTSTMMRDVYITLFIYLSIFLSYLFYKTRSPIYFAATLFSIYCLQHFRPYACYIVAIAILAAYVLHNVKIVKQNSKIKVNKITFILILLSPFWIVGLIFIFIKLTHVFGVISSAEDLINIRESSYFGGDADIDFDFGKIYSICPPLAIFIGMTYMFFAPFPWEWILVRRIVYVPDMIMLYCFLPSFFKNIKLIFKEKNYILTVFFIAILIQFSAYCITLGNSGAIHRNRGPYLPMIYLIAMYRPDKYLAKLLKTVQKWRII